MHLLDEECESSATIGRNLRPKVAEIFFKGRSIARL